MGIYFFIWNTTVIIMTVYINFCLNIEAGAERSMLYGDEGFEDYLPPIPITYASKGQRHYYIEEWFEYGLNVGLPHLLTLFKAYQIHTTLFICGRSIELAPPAIIDMITNTPHEVAGHGYRWINYRDIPLQEEKEHIKKTIFLFKEKLNKTCYGWYTGRRSPHTQQLVAALGLKYNSDYYGNIDIQTRQFDKQTLFLVPYTLYANDINLLPVLGGQSDNDFLVRLKNQLKYLESKNQDVLYTIGLHERISGLPGRLEIIKQFIEFALSKNITFITRYDYLKLRYPKQAL